MGYLQTMATVIAEHWHIWLVSTILIVAAVIDGTQLKVPNWLTFPLIFSGWVYSCLAYAWAGDPWYVGLQWSLLGTALGLGLLLPAYAIGGMGAGDVKLLAGVGAWVHCAATFYGFCVSAIVGAVLALALVLRWGGLRKHSIQLRVIVTEILTIRNPEVLARLAADRKGSMLLLPYGIPMAIGMIFYFAWTGRLI